MEPVYTCRYYRTPNYHKRYLAYLRFIRPSAIVSIVLYSVAFLYVLLPALEAGFRFYFWGDWEKIGTLVIYGFLFPIYASFPVIPVIQYGRQVSRAVRRDREIGVEDEETMVTISEEGIRLSETLLLPYHSCKTVACKCDMIIVITKEKQGLALPKEGFENGEWEAAYRFLKEKLRR